MKTANKMGVEAKDSEANQCALPGDEAPFSLRELPKHGHRSDI